MTYVDRRDRQHWVYRCYDSEDRLLYVGCTMNPKARKDQHRANGAYWLPYMTRHVLRGPFDYETARRIERDLIDELNPYFNPTSEQMSQARRDYNRGITTSYAARKADRSGQLGNYLAQAAYA